MIEEAVALAGDVIVGLTDAATRAGDPVKAVDAFFELWRERLVQSDIPCTPGMAALIQARLAPQAAHRAMVTAHRYGGTDAAAAGIVDRAVAEDAVRTTAIELAQAQVGKAGDTLGTIKARMYGPALAVLRDTATPLG